ncbi:MAG: glycosyltransferase family 4 protein [Oligoflexales bacterium]|nr:glycosyltransferase family 4 protein [Oligoflexales bacterium]
MPKIAFIVQRYGSEVVGGAEALTREIAQALVKNASWSVEVYTSTALDYQTWSQHFQEGREVVFGVGVQRFNSSRRRSIFFSPYNALLNFILIPLIKLLPELFGNKLRDFLEYFWIQLQGPVCPLLIKKLIKDLNEYDHIVFVTYLYYPTIWGIRSLDRLGFKNYSLIAAAHDEPAFHFNIIRKILEKVPIILSLHPEEARLISSKLASSSKIRHIGMGFDDKNFNSQEAVPQNFEKEVFYFGRLSRGKNTHLLIDWMQKYFPSIKVKFAGRQDSDLNIPKTRQFIFLGYLNEGDKVAELFKAFVIVNPSIHESLSMIVIEAIAAGKPVLVNGASSVLRYYSDALSTVFCFEGEESFKEQLDFILKQDWYTESWQKELKKSKNWVLENFGWQRMYFEFRRLVEPVDKNS